MAKSRPYRWRAFGEPPANQAPVTRRAITPAAGQWWITVGSTRCHHCGDRIERDVFYFNADEKVAVCTICGERRGLNRDAKPSKAFKAATVRGDISSGYLRHRA